MKRTLLKVLSILACLTLAFCLVTCGTKGEQGELRETYNSYVENVTTQGDTPLTYEAWLLVIKGEKDNNEELDNLKSEIAELESQLEDQKASLEYYKTESGLQDLYDRLIELEGKK